MSAITPLYKFFSDPIIAIIFLLGQVHHHIMLRAYATGCTFRFLYIRVEKYMKFNSDVVSVYTHSSLDPGGV